MIAYPPTILSLIINLKNKSMGYFKDLEDLKEAEQYLKEKSKGVVFGEALEATKIGKGMRLPSWSPDVVIRTQFPDEHSKMTAPYLYVESRFGRVPWKETMVELFSDKWEVVD